MAEKLRESDLYLPVKSFLNNLGYEVKGEIKKCDIVALKEDSIVIIELKLNLNITLLLQAVDRLSLSETVYIAIPKQCSLYKKQGKQVKKLVARLGLGLILVDMQQEQQYVEVINDPKDYQPRKNSAKQRALLKEFNERLGDTQKGGSTRKKAGLTAYRQRCIRVAQYLYTEPQAKGAEIKRALSEPQASQFLRDDYYAWFNKVARGVYELSENGRSELPLWLEKMEQITFQK